jgi:FAD/FMN-containing dehydrogenase
MYARSILVLCLYRAGSSALISSPGVLVEDAGNLHLNVIVEVYSKEIEEVLEPFVYELVSTISPCHSLFQPPTRAPFLQESSDIMRRVKKLFDERGIMNPGEVLE